MAFRKREPVDRGPWFRRVMMAIPVIVFVLPCCLFTFCGPKWEPVPLAEVTGTYIQLGTDAGTLTLYPDGGYVRIRPVDGGIISESDKWTFHSDEHWSQVRLHNYVPVGNSPFNDSDTRFVFKGMPILKAEDGLKLCEDPDEGCEYFKARQSPVPE